MPSLHNSEKALTRRLGRILQDIQFGALSRKATVVGLSKFSQFLFILLANAVLARTLLQGQFGRYQQIWLLINTLIPALLLGAPQAINYFVPQSDRDRARNIIWQLYFILTLVAAPVTLALFLFPSIGAALLHNPDTFVLVRIASVYVFLMLPTYCLDSILIINNKQWLLLQITLVWSALFFLVNLYFGLTRNLEMIFIALACLGGMKLLLTIAITRHDFGQISGFFKRPLFREVSGYLIVLGAVGLVDVLSVQVDKFLVTILTRSEEAFAIYAVGAYEIPIVALLIGSVTAVAMPEFSRCLHAGENDAAWRLLHSMVKKLAVFIFPLFAYLLASAETVVPLIFSARFAASVPIFLIYLFLLPVRAANNYPLLIAAGLQGWVLLGRLLDVLISVGLGILLIHSFGIAGAAIAIVVGTYVEKTYQSLLMIQHFGVALPRLYPWGFMGRWLLRAVACALPLLLLNAVASRYVAFVLGTLLFVSLYLAFLHTSYRKEVQEG
jgi:O-antigen/teichoic acid export membrane protein